jgi:hypothetical protein
MVEISLKVMTPCCPIQVEGKVNGVALYYRARSGRWELYSGGVSYDGEGQPVSLGTFVDAGPCMDDSEDSVATALARIFDNWPAWGLERGF